MALEFRVWNTHCNWPHTLLPLSQTPPLTGIWGWKVIASALHETSFQRPGSLFDSSRGLLAINRIPEGSCHHRRVGVAREVNWVSSLDKCILDQNNTNIVEQWQIKLFPIRFNKERFKCRTRAHQILRNFHYQLQKKLWSSRSTYLEVRLRCHH